MIHKTRWRCCSCDWLGKQEELLTASNPFDTTELIYGCPKCKAIDDFEATCDQPGCDRPATCGWPSPEGYRSTCGRHYEVTTGEPRNVADD